MRVIPSSSSLCAFRYQREEMEIAAGSAVGGRRRNARALPVCWQQRPLAGLSVASAHARSSRTEGPGCHAARRRRRYTSLTHPAKTAPRTLARHRRPRQAPPYGEQKSDAQVARGTFMAAFEHIDNDSDIEQRTIGVSFRVCRPLRKQPEPYQRERRSPRPHQAECTRCHAGAQASVRATHLLFSQKNVPLAYRRGRSPCPLLLLPSLPSAARRAAAASRWSASVLTAYAGRTSQNLHVPQQ